MDFATRITVEPVLFLYMLASFVSFGVYQDLLYYKTCYVHYANHNKCLHPEGDMLTYTQTQGSHWLLYNNLALYVPSIVVASYIGSWADRHGRKVPMLISVLSTLLGYLIYMLAAHYRDSSVVYLLLANLVTGLGGGFAVLIATVTSYMADITSIESRTTRVAILESMIFLGATLGPLISGYLLEGSDYVHVFLFCILCNAIAEFYIIVRIKDVEAVDNGFNALRENTVQDNAMPILTTTPKVNRCCHFDYFYKGFVTCFKQREGKKNTFILLIISAFICAILASTAEHNILYLYVKDKPLSWSYLTYSQYQCLLAATGTVMLLYGLPLLRRYFQFQDTTLVFLGLASRAAGFIFFAMSTTTVMAFMVPLLALFAIFPEPCYRSMLSKLVDASEHGNVFSMLATVEILFMMVGSVIYNNLYPVTRSFLRGFCFLIAVAFVACAFMLTSFFSIIRRVQPTRTN